MNDGDSHTDPGEKAGDGDVVFVLGPVFAVAHEDERHSARMEPPEFAARAPLFDGLDGDGVMMRRGHNVDAVLTERGAAATKHAVISLREITVALHAFRASAIGDDAAFQHCAGSDFRVFPNQTIAKLHAFADAGFSADDRRTLNLRV